MSDVQATTGSAGLSVVSTFAGVGGSSLGYRMAGYSVLWANEIVSAAADSYRANASKDTIVDTRDIRQVSASDVLEAIGARAGDVDILDGSPPCQPFSIAGKRHKRWGAGVNHVDGTSQQSEDLFFEYIRLLRELRPRAFVAENVSGLLTGKAKGYFKLILRGLREAGYVVGARLLDAKWLGVPQSRQRVIFLGVRDDQGREPVFPTPWPYQYSVREAWEWDSESPTVEDECWKPAPPSRMELVRRIEPGRTGADVLGRQSYWQLERLRWDRPAKTVIAAGGTLVSQLHPSEHRRLSIAELKRVSSFPDDVVLTGSYAEQYARLGNSVPPLMMRAIATCVKESLLGVPVS